MPCSDPKVWKKMNGPTMTPPKYDKKIGRPTKKRRKSALEEDGGTRLSRHGIIGHCGVCNVAGHTRRKCPQLGRGPAEPAAAHEEQAAAAHEEQPAVAQPEQPAAAHEEQPAAAHEVPDDQPKFQAHPPRKMPVKRNTSKKKILPQMSTSATASVVEATMSYDITSSSVIQILQEQAIATQQSQTAPPGPLPESQFIAGCRGDLPPPRPTTATLGLKRKRKVGQKKENFVPKV